MDYLSLLFGLYVDFSLGESNFQMRATTARDMDLMFQIVVMIKASRPVGDWREGRYPYWSHCVLPDSRSAGYGGRVRRSHENSPLELASGLW